MDGGDLIGGRYRLVAHLGTGGMSVVWQAYDEVLDREVAVKVLAPALAPDEAFRGRIRIEAQAAARLSHPHITNVYDYGEQVDEDGLVLPFIVMELLDGQSMAERLAGAEALPWQAAVATCAGVADALAAAHAHGVVHRDVTARNVMLTHTGPKVVDFGISALVGESDATPDGNLLGTPAYVAPERLDADRVDAATDVYALGVLLYRALTGTLPWKASTTAEMLRAHRDAEPAPLPDIPDLPADVSRLCRACLSKRPEDRPSSAAVARRLAAVIGLPATAPADTRVGEDGHDGGATGATAVLSAAALPWLPRGGPAAGGGTDAVDETPVPAPRRRDVVLVAAVMAAVMGVLWAISDWSARPPDPRRAAAPTSAGETPTAVAGAKPGCRVHYDLTRDDGGRFTAAVTVTNLTARPVDNWTLRFAFPGDQELIAGPPRWQQSGRWIQAGPADPSTLAPGDSTTLGFTGRYARANPLPTDFGLNDRSCQTLVSGTAAGGPVATVVSDHTNGNRGGNGNAGAGSGGNGNHGKGDGHGRGDKATLGAGAEGGGRRQRGRGTGGRTPAGRTPPER